MASAIAIIAGMALCALVSVPILSNRFILVRAVTCHRSVSTLHNMVVSIAIWHTSIVSARFWMAGTILPLGGTSPGMSFLIAVCRRADLLQWLELSLSQKYSQLFSVCAKHVLF